MTRFLVKRILFPIILGFLIVALSTLLIGEEYVMLRWLPVIVYLIVLVYWWLTGLARWLVRYGRRWRKGIIGRALAGWLEQTFEERPAVKPAPVKRQRATPQAGATATATRAAASAVTRPMVSNDAQEFVQQAQEWARRQEYVGNYAPFEATIPTYRQMSFTQEQWYFYWRTQLRQGNWLATDLSYLLIYVYELLNLVGANSVADARDRLIAFWQFYRKLQLKLESRLVDWVADFTVLHNLPDSPLSWYAHALSVGVTSRKMESLQLEGWHQQGRDYQALPAPVLYALAGYATEQNKFYQVFQNEMALDDGLKRGVEVIDGYVQQAQQCSLYELHLPAPTQAVVRPPLQGALHLYATTPLVIGRVRPWLTTEPLKNDLRAILRYTENILRTQAGYKTKLRGVTLPSVWASQLDQAFVKVPPKRTVSIDLAGAAALQRESDELRRRLLDGDDANAQPATLSPVEEMQPLTVAEQAMPAAASGEGMRKQLPADAPDGLLTDVAPLVAILGNGSSEATALLRGLRDSHWQSKLSNLKMAGNHYFLNVIFDRVNERALAELGDALIFVEGEEWVVGEDYRDEISYVLDHPDFLNHPDFNVALAAGEAVAVEANVPLSNVPLSNVPASAVEEVDLIPTGWEECVRKLQPLSWATLAIVLEEGKGLEQREVMPKLEELARSHYVTASQLLDQLNETGLDTVGDNLIDVATTPPQVIEEYREALQALLLWAQQNQQFEDLL